MRSGRLVAGVAAMLIPTTAMLAQAPPGRAATTATTAAHATQIAHAAQPWTPTEITLPRNAGITTLAELVTVACVTPGSCVAGGQYQTSSLATSAMLATKANGTWRRAFTLGMPKNAMTSNPASTIESISCPAANSCVAVGSYQDSTGGGQAFTAQQVGGSWQRAREVAKPAGPANSTAALDSVSCVSVGNCVAVGVFQVALGTEMLAVREAAGQWKQAFLVKTPLGKAANPNAFLDSVSCSGGPVQCTAVGGYTDKSGHPQATAVTETNNKWPEATTIELPANASSNPEGALVGVACAQAGQCTAVGNYVSRQADSAMVTTLGKRGWLRATQLKPPSANESMGLNAISCMSAASCVTVGLAFSSSGPVLVVRTHSAGHWVQSPRIGAPANAAKGATGGHTVLSLACFTGGACTAVGSYNDSAGNEQAMAASRPVA